MTTQKTTGNPVLVTYASDTTTKFSSIRSASRSLSGNGSDKLSTSIRRKLKEGGGYVGSNGVWVESI